MFSFDGEVHNLYFSNTNCCFFSSSEKLLFQPRREDDVFNHLAEYLKTLLKAKFNII